MIITAAAIEPMEINYMWAELTSPCAVLPNRLHDKLIVVATWHALRTDIVVGVRAVMLGIVLCEAKFTESRVPIREGSNWPSLPTYAAVSIRQTIAQVYFWNATVPDGSRICRPCTMFQRNAMVDRDI